MAQETILDCIKRALEGEDSFYSLAQLIAEEIALFRKSPAYQRRQEAEAYYRNRSAVQKKTVEVSHRSNTKIEHPILKKLVDQKANYLMGKPWTVDTDDRAYGEALNALFDQSFRRKLKLFVRDAVKYGVAYLQPYFGAGGRLEFLRLSPLEVIPIWEDGEKERLFAFIRFYEQEGYTGLRRTSTLCVEFWWAGGVRRYYADGFAGTDSLTRDKTCGTEATNWTAPHFSVGEKAYNWENVPLLWLRYNDEELPLQYYVKELIDDINWQTSVTADVLRDMAKFIYILKNYGGTDLGEFLKDLREYMAIKVTDDGGVDKLEPSLNIDAVLAFLEKQRRDLYDFADGVDTKDPDLGNASGTAIHFRYMGLDTECADLGEELQATFLLMKPFLDCALQTAGKGDFGKKTFSVVFNMDLPVNETDIINNAKNSKGLISDHTIRQNHPWVKDAEEEEKRMQQEQENAMAAYGGGLFSEAFAVKEAGADDETE